MKRTRCYKTIFSRSTQPPLEKPTVLIVNGKDARVEREVERALRKGVNWIVIYKVILDVGTQYPAKGLLLMIWQLKLQYATFADSSSPLRNLWYYTNARTAAKNPTSVHSPVAVTLRPRPVN
jgi:hypothetical protein